MKKIYLILLGLSFISIFAQNTEETTSLFKKNELRLGAIKALTIPMLDVAYERVTDSTFGYGANLMVAFNDNTDGFYNFAFSPFARMYFTESKEFGSKGFL